MLDLNKILPNFNQNSQEDLNNLLMNQAIGDFIPNISFKSRVVFFQNVEQSGNRFS
jgi:hypothetical protein